MLGGVLLRNEVLAGLDFLTEDQFYDPRHRVVFAAMRRLESKSKPIDEVTLEAELSQEGKLDAVGGLAFLADLAMRVPTADNVEHYAEIIRDKYSARQLMIVASEIASKGYEDYGDVEDYLDQAESEIFKVTQSTERGGPEVLKKLLKDVFSSLDTRFAAPGGITGIPTGFNDLDEKTAGLQPTELIILAARPAMGKTSFALSMAQNAAIGHGWPVIVFSLEMSGAQLAERLLCSEARVDSSALRRGQLQRQDMTNLTYAANNLSKARLMIDGTPALSLRELRARCRRFMADKEMLGDKKFGLIIIDYLQLMRGSETARRASREQEISEISRGLKALAKELNCPVVALSQLNRSLESRPDKRPQMSDLRECVAGNTLVMLADGSRTPIRELVGSTPRVVAMTPQGRLDVALSDKVWRVGTRPLFEVRLASGRTLRATGRHRLYGANGWVRVDDLSEGARIATARCLPEPEDCDEWPDMRVALIGQLIGDGSYLSGQPMRYSTNSADNSRVVEQAAISEFGVAVKRYQGRRHWHQLLISGNDNRWHPAGVNKWLRELGVFNQRSQQKRVPRAAFRLGNRHIALLLRHLWATAGCIWTTKPTANKQRGRIYYSTSSPGLARDVMALLLRLGIVARMKHVEQAGYRPAYHVDVSGRDQQWLFLERVGAFGPRVPQAERLRAMLRQQDANTNVDTLPVQVFDRGKRTMTDRGISQRKMAALRGTSYGSAAHVKFAPSRDVIAQYAELLDDAELRAAAASDVFWDTVTSIDPAGEEDVFDLTVPGPASWLADGIVSHNSGAIEQDADLIMFIYRDVVYNPDTEHPNVAEVIIGKNRHGAIGRVETMFEGRYTRFENLSRRGDG